MYKLKLLIGGTLLLFSFSACQQFSLDTNNQLIVQPVPNQMELKVPSSINSDETLKLVSGRGIYNYLRNFIHLAMQSEEILNNTYTRISVIEAGGISEFNYTGIDGKIKLVSLQSNYEKDGKIWDYYMQVFSETFSQKALQVYWKTDGSEQVAILMPHVLNALYARENPNTLVRLHYRSLEKSKPYDASLTIELIGLNTSVQNPYMPDKLKLFVGKLNGNVSIIGGSNNPNVLLFDQARDRGRNWAFIVKANINQNIAIAKLAVANPDWDTNTELMENFALSRVLIDEIREVYPEYINLTDDELFSKVNIDAGEVSDPAFYNVDGFLGSGGNFPNSYQSISDFSDLQPFVPIKIHELDLSFDSSLK